MQELDLYSFKLNVYKNIIPSDSLIEEMIKEFTPENAIAALFFKCGITVDKNIPYIERYNYFYNLAKQIKRMSNYDYSDDDLKIYAMYAIPLYPMPVADSSCDITKRLEDIFDLTPSGENEIFAKESVKYKLLHLYSEQLDNGKYEDMKKLLTTLKENASVYEDIKNKVFGKINKG